MNQPMLVIRSNAHIPMPQFAIVQVNADGSGEDVAWVFDEAVAKRILDLLKTPEKDEPKEP